jgi:hypothetical protein
MYQAYADKYNVSRTTLSRRHRGVSQSREDYKATQRVLTTPQEQQLVRYIKTLTERRIPPTRALIRQYASLLAPWELGDAWVTRFLHRHQFHLISRWSAGLDQPRHAADNLGKFNLYFDLLHDKMREYNVEPRFSYNMDEKGFMIGVEGRSKRVFDKEAWVKGGCRAALQDGNREWITTMPTVCADGTSLPPAIIFQAENGNIWEPWVNQVTPDQEPLFVSSSASGWSNDELGLAWLRDVFDRYTKEKCRRSYRLLILDGHGSHVTPSFIDYCHENRILLAVFPPHSTHRLQPLDVVLFAPLARAYSSELRSQTTSSQGLVSIIKSSFIPLFRSAYTKAFTKANIITSFEATGIWPMDRTRVTAKLDYPSPASRESSPTSWKHVEQVLDQVVKDPEDKAVRRLKASIHRAATASKLLTYELDGLKASFTAKNTRRQRGKQLPLPAPENPGGGAIFWSPRKIHDARAKKAETEAAQHVQELKKVEMRELRAANKLYKEKIAEEKRVERQRAKVVREKEKAEEAKRLARVRREKQQQKDAATATKALQSSQRGKRPASKKPAPRKGRVRRVVGAAGGATPTPAPAAPKPPTTSYGRPLKVPSKFR